MDKLMDMYLLMDKYMLKYMLKYMYSLICLGLLGFACLCLNVASKSSICLICLTLLDWTMDGGGGGAPSGAWIRQLPLLLPYLLEDDDRSLPHSHVHSQTHVHSHTHAQPVLPKNKRQIRHLPLLPPPAKAGFSPPEGGRMGP